MENNCKIKIEKEFSGKSLEEKLIFLAIIWKDDVKKVNNVLYQVERYNSKCNHCKQSMKFGIDWYCLDYYGGKKC